VNADVPLAPSTAKFTQQVQERRKQMEEKRQQSETKKREE